MFQHFIEGNSVNVSPTRFTQQRYVRILPRNRVRQPQCSFTLPGSPNKTKREMSVIFPISTRRIVCMFRPVSPNKMTHFRFSIILYLADISLEVTVTDTDMEGSDLIKMGLKGERYCFLYYGLYNIRVMNKIQLLIFTWNFQTCVTMSFIRRLITLFDV